MTNRTVAFLLDETGSMQIGKAVAISAFNEYLSMLKAGGGDPITFHLTRFNSAKINTVEKPLAEVPDLTDATYQPDHMTPLYDAIGRTIRAIQAKSDPGQVVFVIQTDGEENSSHEYKLEAIKNLIAERTAAGWTFAFIGAAMSDWAAQNAASAMGVLASNSMAYHRGDTRAALGAVAEATHATFRTGVRNDEFLTQEMRNRRTKAPEAGDDPADAALAVPLVSAVPPAAKATAPLNRRSW